MKFIKLTFLLLLCSCNSNNKITFKEFIKNIPTDSEILIETYDGSNQVVHPDVLWGKNHLIMGITPYPYFNDDLENPCLYESTDGVNFDEYSTGINPLVKKPVIDHNCDPDILFDKNGNLVVFYVEMLRPHANNIISLTQKGKTPKFKKRTLLHYNLSKNEPLVVSPSVIYNKNTKQYYMYFVNIVSPNKIEYIQSKSITKFNKNETKEIKIKFPKNYSPWHLDVLKGDDDQYYLLTAGFYGNQENNKYSLFLAKSSDLINWTDNTEILSRKDVPHKNLNFIYRSTALISQNKITIWYSFTIKPKKVGTTATWHLAVKKLPLPKSLRKN